ncbi:hypothetical protein GOODEAATRI_017125 [Goodea atripinnis]|uniref:Uncharacterized protein n=1 Tax=Goodea atripinnis TaxID=208336 RepID=A0ABV0PES8_9TELE
MTLSSDDRPLLKRHSLSGARRRHEPPLAEDVVFMASGPDSSLCAWRIFPYSPNYRVPEPHDACWSQFSLLRLLRQQSGPVKSGYLAPPRKQKAKKGGSVACQRRSRKHSRG